MFPDTPQTLLKKIAELANGDDAAEWSAFVELYDAPLHAFIRTVNGGLSPEAVDDAVQDVFIKLVEVLRNGKIDRAKAKFRAYLAAMTRRLLIDRYRESLVRPTLLETASEESVVSVDGAAVGSNSLDTADPGLLFDASWRLSVREAAIEHVLTKTAVSEQSKAIYRALQGQTPELRGLSPKEIARHFGVSYDGVKQVKSRLDRAVSAIEATCGMA